MLLCVTLCYITKMAVVRIDDELLKKLKEFLKRDENRYKYNSISSLINYIIYEKLNQKGDKK